MTERHDPNSHAGQSPPFSALKSGGEGQATEIGGRCGQGELGIVDWVVSPDVLHVEIDIGVLNDHPGYDPTGAVVADRDVHRHVGGEQISRAAIENLASTRKTFITLAAIRLAIWRLART